MLQKTLTWPKWQLSRGIYVDIVTGEPLFSSGIKFDAGCGWPSFTKALVDDHIVEKLDRTHGMFEQKSEANLETPILGHVFPDGPEDMGGLRYCINGAALRFIRKEDLEKEGYGDYLKSFE